jgi:hypothetical protein
VPKCILQNSPKVARLFPDYRTVERDYYQRTGIFPVMHTVVMRKDLALENPGLAKTVYRGFCAAKDAAMDHYNKGLTFNNIDTMIPWLSPLIEENRQLLGDDWCPMASKPIARRSTLSCATTSSKVFPSAG